MFSLALVHQAFNAEVILLMQPLAQRFENNLVAFVDLVEAAKNYPCIKKAWVEFWERNLTLSLRGRVVCCIEHLRIEKNPLLK